MNDACCLVHDKYSAARSFNQAASMEYLSIHNVSFPFGVNVTRLLLYNQFSMFGQVTDVLLNEKKRMGCIAFADSTHAQNALVHLSGLVLFGEQTSLCISPAPVCAAAPDFLITLCTTTTLYVQRVPFLHVKVTLQRVRGVTRVTSVGLDECVIYTKSEDVAAMVKRLLTFHQNRHRENASVVYLRNRLV